MAIRYTNIKIILDKILRDSLFTGLSYEAVLDDYIDFMGIVRVPNLFINKFDTLTIENYRAALPDDLLAVNQILLEGKTSREGTDTFHNFYHQMEAHLESNQSGTITTNTPTHKVEGGYLYTSLKEGTAAISYQAIPIEEGVPAIPDDPKFIRAFKNYVEVNFLKMLFRNKKVERNVLEHAEQEYAWAVGAYETSSKAMDLSKAESFMNSYMGLLSNRNSFTSRFKHLGNKGL
jgi:hypothetical protein